MLIHCFLINVNKGVLFKCVKQSTLSLPAMANLATKTKTYYESLGLQPTATYDEIKSAYYKLTLKYHPDRNKSEFAKEMFNEISNAYYVLSKYETRKLYDEAQSIIQDSQILNKKKYGRFKPQNTQLYKNQPTHNFNFDEWVRQHYSNTFQNDMLMKKRQKIDMQNMETKYKIPDIPTMMILFTLTILILFTRDYINDRKHEDFIAAQKRSNK